MLNGTFSIDHNKKVHISQGNLQYQASTKTWRFAEHQWDMIGDGNKNISSNYSGWIDLFGWGTGNNPTQSDYSSFNDWGNNNISNGQGKKWFTLTKEEWNYVFNLRNTKTGIRYTKAVVNGVNGVILLPDNWNANYYTLSDINNSRARFSSNTISQNDWNTKFEANGAVFLPLAGYLSGKDVDRVGLRGNYWSATGYDIRCAYCVGIDEYYINAEHVNIRLFGYSVRLVCSADK